MPVRMMSIGNGSLGVSPTGAPGARSKQESHPVGLLARLGRTVLDCVPYPRDRSALGLVLRALSPRGEPPAPPRPAGVPGAPLDDAIPSPSTAAGRMPPPRRRRRVYEPGRHPD